MADPTTRRDFLRGALGVGAVALTGCAPSSDDSGRKLEAPATTKAPSGEITVWNRSGDLYKVFDSAIPAFNKKYPQIKVKHVQVDIGAKLPNTLITGADVPDGSFFEDASIPGHATHLSDLSELLAPYVKDIAKYKVDVNSVDGKIFGVPWDLNPGLLYYRADLFDAAGVDPDKITTYDELLGAARTLQQANPQAKPIHLDRDKFLGQLWLEMLANQQNTSLADAEGKVRLDSEEYRRILTWIKTAVDDKLVSHTEYHKPADLAAMDNGVQSIIPWAIWWNFAPQQLLKKTKGKWRGMRLPAWTPGGVRSGSMGGSSFVIPAKSKNPHLAWLFFEFMVFDPQGYSTVYGPNQLYPGGLNTSIPSYLPAMDPDKPLFKPIPALGDQDLWKLAVESGKEIPGSVPTPGWWARSVDYLGNNLQRMIEHGMSPDEVISKSAEQIQTNLVKRR